MRTRRGFSYPSVGAPTTKSRKRGRFNFFDMLPDDIVLLILVKLVYSANCPADFVAALLVCKRFNCLGLNPSVLSKASAETFAVKPGWFSAAKWFFQRCADAGNVEAYYIMGMIHFYCFHDHKLGASLMAKAAIKSHPPALYSLAIIQFNGSGGINAAKDLKAGATLCARAAFLGHVDAMRELGHCLLNGHGLARNVAEGEMFLRQANFRELATRMSPQVPSLLPGLRLNLPPIFFPVNRFITGSSFRSANWFCFDPPRNCHPANRFLVSWYNRVMPDKLFLNCSYIGCGRLETKVHEFRRCAACGVMHYCSRGCQARAWVMGHNRHCRQLGRYPIFDAGAAGI